jgi:hypothetical protein
MNLRARYETHVAKLARREPVPTFAAWVLGHVLVVGAFIITFCMFAALVTCSRPASASDTVSLDDRNVITVGQSDGQLHQLFGEPTRIITLQNYLGGAVGERWDYFLPNKVVSFYISGGRIYRIDERTN